MTHRTATGTDAVEAWLTEAWRHGEVVAGDGELLVAAPARRPAVRPRVPSFIALIALVLALAVLAGVTALLA